MRQRRTSRGKYRRDVFETAGAAQAFVTALEEALERLGRCPADLAGVAKGAAWKVALAAELRHRAGPSLTWLASRLHMGKPSSLRSYLCRKAAGQDQPSAA